MHNGGLYIATHIVCHRAFLCFASHVHIATVLAKGFSLNITYYIEFQQHRLNDQVDIKLPTSPVYFTCALGENRKVWQVMLTSRACVHASAHALPIPCITSHRNDI